MLRLDFRSFRRPLVLLGARSQPRQRWKLVQVRANFSISLAYSLTFCRLSDGCCAARDVFDWCFNENPGHETTPSLTIASAIIITPSKSRMCQIKPHSQVLTVHRWNDGVTSCTNCIQEAGLPTNPSNYDPSTFTYWANQAMESYCNHSEATRPELLELGYSLTNIYESPIALFNLTVLTNPMPFPLSG
jgi:hypothetical protein